MPFSAIAGHESAKAYLKRALDRDTLPNALLFVGLDGVGKRLLAIHLASFILGSVDISRLDRGAHPDLREIFPEGKTGSHTIGAIRSLGEEVFKTPFESKAKVFIIHAADRMQTAAANAFLKTLEEPTQDSYLILLSDNFEGFLPTILSRCAKINFGPLSKSELETVLKQKGLSYSNASLHLSCGSVKKAIELSGDEKRIFLLKVLSKEEVRDFADLSDALVKFEALFEKEEKEEDFLNLSRKMEEVLTSIIMWYRDLHLIKVKKEEMLYFSDQLLLLKKQDLTHLPPLDLVYEAIEKARLGIERNIKFKSCLEQLFLRIGFII